MRTFLFVLLLPACSYSTKIVEEDSTATVVGVSPQREAPEEPKYNPPPKDPDACVPQRFAADAIPYGFQYDPSCPPNIYAPPRWIPPWDPSPIIQHQ